MLPFPPPGRSRNRGQGWQSPPGAGELRRMLHSQGPALPKAAGIFLIPPGNVLSHLPSSSQRCQRGKNQHPLNPLLFWSLELRLNFLPHRVRSPGGARVVCPTSFISMHACTKLPKQRGNALKQHLGFGIWDLGTVSPGTRCAHPRAPPAASLGRQRKEI